VPVDDSNFQAAMDALAARVSAAGPGLVVKAAGVIDRAGMARTKVVTGSLRRSWRITGPETDGMTASAQVGPTMVYARRQELGFLPPLKDSLGRSFPNDPGWPYVRPAFDESEPMVLSLFRSGIADAIRG
jgi:hypothetical protein